VTRRPGHGPGEVIAARAAAASGILEDPDWRGRPHTPIRSARSFEGRSDQVASARAFVRQALGPVPVLDEAVLLVSELCTNALQHTESGRDGTFEVTVIAGPGHLRIEVQDDGSSHAPALYLADDAAEAGRGLGLVELLADRWGHSGDHDGRLVFFELNWAKPD
jgi:anti-sigma regulatory factor (Ser/Thr protein kinase)